MKDKIEEYLSDLGFIFSHIENGSKYHYYHKNSENLRAEYEDEGMCYLIKNNFIIGTLDC